MKNANEMATDSEHVASHTIFVARDVVDPRTAAERAAAAAKSAALLALAAAPAEDIDSAVGYL